MIPWQEGVEVAIGPPVGDALEGELELSVRIDVVEFGGRSVARMEQVRPPPSEPAKSEFLRVMVCGRMRALDGIVLDVEPTIVKEAFERGAPPYSVADRVGRFGFARDPLELDLQRSNSSATIAADVAHRAAKWISGLPPRRAMRSTVQVAEFVLPA